MHRLEYHLDMINHGVFVIPIIREVLLNLWMNHLVLLVILMLIHSWLLIKNTFQTILSDLSLTVENLHRSNTVFETPYELAIIPFGRFTRTKSPFRYNGSWWRRSSKWEIIAIKIPQIIVNNRFWIDLSHSDDVCEIQKNCLIVVNKSSLTHDELEHVVDTFIVNG